LQRISFDKHRMVAKKEKAEPKEGERKSSRVTKAVERLTVTPVAEKKKAITKKTSTPKKTKTTKGTKKSKKDGPKRALSAFMYFSKENRSKIQKENPDAGFGELGKLLGEAWSEATASEKKKYNALAEKDKARYEKEKKALVCLLCVLASFFVLLTNMQEK
jgi:HMG (high mobility group) box